MIENWYDIPVILVGCFVGSWLGNLLALWIKRRFSRPLGETLEQHTLGIGTNTNA